MPLLLLFFGLLLFSIYGTRWSWIKINEEFENRRISEIAQEIKSTNEISIKSKGSLGFDLQSSINKSKAAATKIYDRTVKGIRNTNYNDWLAQIENFFKDIRTNTFATLNKIFKYFIHLTSPVESVKIDEKEEKSDKKAQNIKEIKKNVHKTHQNTVQKEDIISQQSSELISQEPTLSMAKDKKPFENKNKNAIFTRLEERILKKLNTNGMEDYASWLELGQLYIEFNQLEKAKQIFALVMKHSDGKERDRAKDALIGIG